MPYYTRFKHPDGANGITRTVYSLNKYLNENGFESKFTASMIIKIILRISKEMNLLK